MARDIALNCLHLDTGAMRRAANVLRERFPDLARFWDDSAIIAEARAGLASLYLPRLAA